MTRHPDAETLARLVAGEYGPERADPLLEHLTECDSCLELADQLWGGVAGLAETLDVPPMEPESRLHVERRVLRRIHAAHLGTQVTWIVTTGFVRVLVALMQPLLTHRSRIPEEGAGR